MTAIAGGLNIITLYSIILFYLLAKKFDFSFYWYNFNHSQVIGHLLNLNHSVMESVIIKHRVWVVIDVIIGGFLILVGIEHLVLSEDPLKAEDWIGSIFNIVLGAIIIVSISGTFISRISVSENNLKIKWSTRFREVTIPDAEIKMIILSKSYFEIQRQEKKTIVMSIEFWRKNNKTKVYEFLTEYARQKNLPLDIRYKQTS